MRVLNPMPSRRRAIDDLRLAIACLPRATREAMLEGLAANHIIVGAYSNRDGICPMLAAHRAGGRTSFIGFAQAWDRFAQRNGAREARRTTERELLILRTHLRASLPADEAQGETLGDAITEHRRLLARSASRAADARAQDRALRPRPAPGDRDRSRELHHRSGWAWTRVCRRYDDYEP